MIITRTPFRISFFGGGTDYPAWAAKHGGSVVATTINKYCYISCRHLPPFFEHKHRIVYSKIENVVDPAEIEHPAVRAVLMNTDSAAASRSITMATCPHAPASAPAHPSPSDC